MAQSPWEKREKYVINTKFSFIEEKIREILFMVSHTGLCLNIAGVSSDFSSALTNPLMEILFLNPWKAEVLGNEKCHDPNLAHTCHRGTNACPNQPAHPLDCTLLLPEKWRLDSALGIT